ncbi:MULTISPECIES: DoxX family membrane protein [unclassified Nocardiopsis]|uniref:DoxX family membrane protein n=1 Tax=unclassified Nocardiopsis TaxID=2649073 RepID=UPI0013597ECC|nr:MULTISPECIES: DoxX family membrane protein [unclassified Nocardiopsis]
MQLPFRVRDLPLRIATGAFLLNSGLEKRDADEEAALGMHGMAAGTYPFLKDVDPTTFARLLSAGEIALGAALLLPVVPSRLAGAGLTAFAGGLLGMYLRTPGMRRPNSLRPSEQGLPLSKDVWLLGAGLSLLLSSDTDRRPARRRR